ncbi:hypothetical protein BC826DRAFT_1157052 [Russula brevipes]|nr:hypothetical protein BC826DRAFT_1157052 [Russula brevipes]
MPSSHSHSHSKHHASSFASSPAWSLNSLTGTTASVGGGLPVTPVLSPVGIAPRVRVRARVSSASLDAGFSAHTAPTGLHGPPARPIELQRRATAVRGVPPPGVPPQRTERARDLDACAPHRARGPGYLGGRFYAASAHGGAHAVTVREVLHALHAKLSERASQAEYNQLPSENHRRAASSSFGLRNRAAPDPAGLRRFDLLGGRTTFAGLQRAAANGAEVWHVCFI